MKFKNSVLKEFFIFSRSFLTKSFRLRSGGTFLKLFPVNLTIKTMKDCYEKGHYVILYMHPNEFLKDGEFIIPFKDFYNYSFPKNIIKYSRQIHWHNVVNNSVDIKIENITSLF